MNTPFFGPAYTSRSKNLADNRCINLFPEIVETRQGKEIGALYSTPGLRFLGNFGAGPIRALHVLRPEGTLFALSGNQLFRITSGFSGTNVGSAGSTRTGSAAIIDNGTQVAVFNGPRGSVYRNGGLAQIELPFIDAPISAASQDGFGVINQPGSTVWWQSDLLDLSVWDGLNFASADTNPDGVVAIAQLQRRMYLIKETGTEIWGNVGTAGFVFARASGYFIEHGTVAPQSVAKSGESLLWLSRNEEGHGVVVEIIGYQARRVSTSGIENLWSRYPRISDAIGYAYQQNGHHFYVITFPKGDATWVYDRTVSNTLGVPCWHQRDSIDPGTGVVHRHWSNSHAFFDGMNVVGDYRNGNLYALDLDASLDHQTPRRVLRSWRALKEPTETPTRFASLELDMETGIRTGPAAEPQVGLKWSDDGGHNWSNGMLAQAGGPGDTARRVIFRRLGSTRRDAGLDRLFEVTLSSDSLPTALIGASIE